MDAGFLILLVALLVGFIGLFWLLKKTESGTKAKISQELNSQLQLLQNQITEMNKIVDSKLGETNKTMLAAIQAQAGQANQIVQEVTRELTHVKETNKQVINVADQLKNLQDILKNPKQRGVLGEYYLETVLKNVLPPKSYQMQYLFQDGTAVDAVVFVKDKVIPVDSKFSLENYQRILAARDESEKIGLEKAFKQDLKNRIDETAKYIKPAENTMDFAFMFIPSEAIYYDLLINKVGAVQISTQDLVEYAFKEKHVIIVSPTSFLAYLQTVLQGLRALQIEESAKEIRKNVEKLSKHLLQYDNYLKKLGVQLGTVVNTYNTGYQEFNKINKDVTKITGVSGEIEVVQLEKPKESE